MKKRISNNRVLDCIIRKQSDSVNTADAPFEVVGDALVTQDFMIVLASAIDNKIDLFDRVIAMPELLGKGYYGSLGSTERVVLGACIIKLIETKRVQLLNYS